MATAKTALDSALATVPVARATIEWEAVGQTAGRHRIRLLAPGKTPRVWAIPHFAPSATRWNGLSWPCASWRPRPMARP